MFSKLILTAAVLLTLSMPALSFSAFAEEPAEAPANGATAPTSSGLPIPRFVTLRTGEINLRTGPGVRYPVDWVYHREGLPVEITAEYDTWRRIRDMDGAEGWVHQSMLSGRRAFIVTGNGVQPVYKTANSTAATVAQAEPQVMGELISCENAWCEVKFPGTSVRGWMPKGTFYGAYDEEVYK